MFNSKLLLLAVFLFFPGNDSPAILSVETDQSIFPVEPNQNQATYASNPEGPLSLPVDSIGYPPCAEFEIPHYNAYKVATPPCIDGRLDEAVWQVAPQSTAFRDLISGSKTIHDTRVSVLWDDEFLYVGYWIEEPEVKATLTERDSKIYMDNDVELFIAGEDTYYEFEINAFGTIYEVFFIWEESYKKGGYDTMDGFGWDEPGRIPFHGVGYRPHPRGPRIGFWNWDFPGLQSAVFVDGTVNDDRDRDRGWTVELALPWSGMSVLAKADDRSLPPQDQDIWRMDFSRFNQYKEAPPATDPGGWAWSPHGVWDSHVPECFTFIHFSIEEIGNNAPTPKRGMVVYPSDLISLGAREWVKLLKESELNLLGIHTDTRLEPISRLKSYLESEEGKLLTDMCEKEKIDIEFEMHVLQDILPRDLFHEHPEYFRMDEKGTRQKEYNMCFSSEGAYLEIENNLKEVCKWLKPTTHRYFFWTDDVGHAFCRCNQCREYSDSEQALIYEKRLLTIMRKIDPEAMVAHLAYSATLEAPEKVKPSDGIFLEYAPISRDYGEPLSEKHVQDLQDNLKVFPAETAHILEYWLDVSMFSQWKKDKLVEIPWNMKHCERDVKQYTSYGIGSITSFGAWINSSYMDKYGEKKTEGTIHEYGKVLNKFIK